MGAYPCPINWYFQKIANISILKDRKHCVVQKYWSSDQFLLWAQKLVFQFFKRSQRLVLWFLPWAQRLVFRCLPCAQRLVFQFFKILRLFQRFGVINLVPTATPPVWLFNLLFNAIFAGLDFTLIDIFQVAAFHGFLIYCQTCVVFSLIVLFPTCYFGLFT